MGMMSSQGGAGKGNWGSAFSNMHPLSLHQNNHAKQSQFATAVRLLNKAAVE